MPACQPALPVFADLRPQTVLDALDAVGLRGDGRLLQLNSYENRVFQVMLEDAGAVAAKVYRPGRWSDAQILEEHGFVVELSHAELPVLAPLKLALQADAPAGAQVTGDQRTLLRWPVSAEDRPASQAKPDDAPLRIAASPWLGGRDPSMETPQDFERLGRLIGRVHAVGGLHSFAHRTALTPERGTEAIDTLLGLEIIDPALLPGWISAAQQAMEAVQDACARTAGTGGLRTLRLHGDAHRGNLLERGGVLHLVDFDDACTGPAMQDLWLFLDGQDGQSRRRQLDALLRGYEDFAEFDDAELRLIEPLRTLRMLRHAAWIALRWQDPAFSRAFADFGSPNHWADQTVMLKEQVARMKEASGR
jgi:Ser/Thr protein kinase RdoA (MazF antagonist)